ncbi:MAG: hypothetical protein H6839_10190 [Planctomycetes bacterium]|nr:hypothetical protein [Planctomycetota bacterium]
MKRIIALHAVFVSLLLLFVACGQSAPPSPPKQAKAPPKEQQREDTSAADAERQSRFEAQNAIDRAKTEEEAIEGRGLYTGTQSSGLLDETLQRKLTQLDHLAYLKVVDAIQQTKTPPEARTQAKGYTGEPHKDDLAAELKAHIARLLKNDPSLKDTAGGSSAPSGPSNNLAQLFDGCETESDADARVKAYKGDASQDQLLAAMEVWRWRSPNVVDQASINLRFQFGSKYLRFSDGRIALQMDQTTFSTFLPDGTKQITATSAKNFFNFPIGISPDEKYLYTAGGDSGMIQKWDAQTGELVLAFGSVKTPYYVGPNSAILPDGSRVVSCSNKGHITLWDAENGAFIRHIATIPRLEAVRFSADSKLLIAASQDAIRTYEVDTAKKLHEFTIDHATFRQFDVSPDGKKMAFRGVLPGEPTPAGPPGPPQESVVIADAETGNELGRVPVDSSVVSVHWLESERNVLVSLYQHLVLIDAESMGIVHSHDITTQPEGSFMSRDRKTLTQFIGQVTKDGKLVLPNFLTYGRNP